MAERVIRRDELEAAFSRDQHRLSLAGIFIGAFASLGLGILFITLGVAAGVVKLATTATGGAAGGGVWILVSVFVATYIGAAIGVRSSGIYYKRDGGTQGVVTWALSFFLSMVFVSFVGAAALSAASGGGTPGGGMSSGPAWWFFIAACAGLLGGFLGGLSGAPMAHAEHERETRRAPSLREREV